jgi:hypothetical protein
VTPAAGSRVARDRILLAAWLGVAALLRVATARGDLWLDEIWTLSFAREAAWPWEILTAIHHDNNHPLNTFILFLTVKMAGAHASSIVYRVLPLVAGLATVGLLFWTELRTGDHGARRRAWCAAILSGCSFLAILYSSEARGYAPAACFAVAAFAVVRGSSLTSGTDRAIFGALCTLGLLSHLTFVFVYAGLACWTFARLLRAEGGGWRAWIALHQIPVVVAAGIYLIDARKLTYGSGPPFQIADVLGRALSLSIGGASAGAWQIVGVLAAVASIACGAALLVWRKNDEAVFFAVTLVLAPASVLLFYEPRYMDVRYFFVLVPFIWLLAARTLAALADRGSFARACAAALLVVSTLGNLLHLLPALPDGRGRYLETVATMARLTPSREITVGSDHDFRNRMLLEYYGEALPAGRKLTYVQFLDLGSGSAEWFITHSFDLPSVPVSPQAHLVAGGTPYVWVQSFRYGGISGWNWHLYRRQGTIAECGVPIAEC